VLGNHKYINGMTDNARRKQIRDELRFRARKDFDNGLPMGRDKFQSLFDYLDLALQEERCNDDHSLTARFLSLIGVENSGDVIGWLIEHDGFCDCETLANVEQHFE